MMPMLPWLVGGGLLLASGMAMAAVAPASTTTPAPPSLAWVLQQMDRYGYPPPAVGHSCIVGIPRRTADGTLNPPDPWDDWLGVLKNLGGGRYAWLYGLGTCDPGWKPMWGQGAFPTAPEGASRLYAPQFSPNAYGGGYHNHNTGHPAFRQTGTVQIEIFNKSTGKWRGPINSRAHQNFHTTGRIDFDWKRSQARGVGDHSHGCIVVLAPSEHRAMLKLGGWTPDESGVRLGVMMLPFESRGVA